MAYSIDLREKVLKYREKHSLRKTHKTFGISITTILDWERLQKENGNLEKRPLCRSYKKINPIELAAFIVDKPDSYLHEIASHFNCSVNAVSLALEKQSITLKKLKFVIARQMKKNENRSKRN